MPRLLDLDLAYLSVFPVGQSGRTLGVAFPVHRSSLFLSPMYVLVPRDAAISVLIQPRELISLFYRNLLPGQETVPIAVQLAKQLSLLCLLRFSCCRKEGHQAQAEGD